MANSTTPARSLIDDYVKKVEERLNPVEQFAYYYSVGLLLLILLLGLAVAVKASNAGETNVSGYFLLAIAVGCVVVAVSATIGLLLGFLFGIPRSLQRASPVAPATPDRAESPTTEQKAQNAPDMAASARAFITNTSLEEISDWLTKIIIGLSLVQFQTFIEYIYKASSLAASYVASESITGDLDLLSYNPAFASPFFFALIIAALVAGCLFAYLETRTRLTLLFLGAEQVMDDRLRDRLRKADDPGVLIQVELPVTKELLAAGEPIKPSKDDQEIATIRRDSISDPKLLLKWASAQARLGNLQVAEDALRDALQADPADDKIRARLIDVRRLRKNYAGAVEVTREIIDRTSDVNRRAELLRQALYSALYVEPPAGFTAAIEFSDKLLAMPEGGDAITYLWRAGAFGQKYLWAVQNSGSADQKLQARNASLESVKKVVELKPDYHSFERSLLRSLFDPAAEQSPSDEDDLAVFKDDPEFREVIYQGKPN